MGAFLMLCADLRLGVAGALRLGYLDRVVPAGELAGAVCGEVARLRALDPPSFAATKARINEAAPRAVGTAIDDELRAASLQHRETPAHGAARSK